MCAFISQVSLWLNKGLLSSNKYVGMALISLSQLGLNDNMSEEVLAEYKLLAERHAGDWSHAGDWIHPSSIEADFTWIDISSNPIHPQIFKVYAIYMYADNSSLRQIISATRRGLKTATVPEARERCRLSRNEVVAFILRSIDPRNGTSCISTANRALITTGHIRATPQTPCVVCTRMLTATRIPRLQLGRPVTKYQRVFKNCHEYPHSPSSHKCTSGMCIMSVHH